MTNEDILRLIERIANHTATEEEIHVYHTWCQSFQDSEEDLKDFSELRSKMFQRIEAQIDRPKPGSLRKLFYMASAAAAILICIGAYFYLSNRHMIRPKSSGSYANDIKAGHQQATLTLADGKIIDLSEVKVGLEICNGQLSYTDGSLVDQAPLPVGKFNEQSHPGFIRVDIPKGGTYQVNLPDGSRVWLNAASSLQFPSAFSHQEFRKVILDGEAYFEVVHNSKQPFIVESRGQRVQVLGTHFNISSYKEEQTVKTTLFQGSVQIVSDGQSQVLLPGQQALQTGKGIRLAKQVDLEEVLSWKQGYFKFNEDLKGIMGQVARWYNVSVVYRDDVDLNQTFSGEISRSRNLSALLKIMEATGNVRFEIEGRRVTVMK